MFEYQPLKGLHQLLRSIQNVWSSVLVPLHSCGASPARAEHVCQDATQLVCTAPQEPGADAIQTCSLSHLDLEPFLA